MKPKPSNSSTLKPLLRLLSYVRPYRAKLTLSLVALVIGAALGLVLPRVFGGTVDAAFTTKDREQLNFTALLLIGLFALQAVAIWIRHYWMSWVGERVVADLRIRLQGHLLSLSQSYLLEQRTGELLSRLSDDVSKIQDVVGQDLSLFLRNLFAIVFGIPILAWISPKLTGVMLLVVPPLVLMAGAWGRKLRKLSGDAQGRLATASGSLAEGLSGIEVVQAFTREQHETKRYESAIEHALELLVAKIHARAWFMTSTGFLASVSIAGIFWVGGNMVVDGELSPGDLTSFFFYTMGLAAAVGSLAALFGRLSAALGATERIFEILDHAPVIADPENPVSLEQPQGNLSFENVSFSYQDASALVLKDVTLAVPAGQVVALVGTSGSGKTTLGRLALRFWDPTAGRVTLDGHDLKQYRLQELRGVMALVGQDPILFSDSVRENIRYGRLEATDAEVEEAARAAHAHDFLLTLPEGYDTRVGERGMKLSGGQRQRVAIARALLRDPKLLILDEATSALDTASEAMVQVALERLQKGRTTLVIAHRLSTIREADQIVVLEHGSIVEQGTHTELLSQKGTYAAMVEGQALLDAN